MSLYDTALADSSLYDIGANLTHDDFRHDLNQVIDDAKRQGVHRLMVTGASVKGSHDAYRLARQFPDYLFSTAGIHPHHAEEATDEGMEQIAQLCKHASTKAVGETGLDFFRNFSDQDDQRRSFEEHIQLAKDTGLPMFLHERDAHPDFYRQLAPHRSNLTNVVVHCFTGEEDALKAYIEMDCYIGITGWICDERRGHHLHELIELIPEDRLLIETDSPYLLPRSLKPKPKSRRNEPKHLAHIATYIAELLGVTPKGLADTTTRNANRFFQT